MNVLGRRVAAEFVGTAFLVMAVVGSGVMASRFSPDDAGLQLLQNSLATGAALVALIAALQPVSASFNPMVTLVERALGMIDTRTAAGLVAFAVGGYITAAYWFTSSTSFANPAVTVARTVTDTFAGIAPSSAPAFILAQLLGGAAGYVLVRFLYPPTATPAVVPADRKVLS